MEFKAYAQRVFCFNFFECVSFYKDAIGLPLSFGNDDMGWAEFNVGDISLAVERLEENDPEAQALVGRFVGLSLEVDDIESVYNELLGRGVEFSAKPQKQAWGGTLAHFVDPANNIITLLGRKNA